MSRSLNDAAIAWRREALLVAAVFVAASWWGTTYWKLSLEAGRTPQFYQQYFEPAVMIACGHGFVIAHPAPQPLADFLQRKVDTFSCEQVTERLDLSTRYLYQGAWRYLMYAVGITWWWTGVSWSKLAPLAGILFGLTIAAAYGIFRQGMGVSLSLIGSFLLSVSTLQLTNLPHLRDYSKAPFTLAAVLILALLARLPVRRVVVVVLCLAYGIVLGVGYGFRTDLLINIPPIVVVLFLFLDGGVRNHLATKTLGVAAFVVAFLATAWPIVSFVNRVGGAQWHVALLGFSDTFDNALRIDPGPYRLGEFYADGYVGRQALAYAARVHPEWGKVTIFTHDYDVVTGAYFREIATRFPADLLTRAYASALMLTYLPFHWPGPPIDGLATWIYRPREVALNAAQRAGPYLMAGAMAVAAAYRLRIGFFLLFLFLYFGGYPALQFAPRHYFHLEFMTFWAAGFVCYQLVRRPRGELSWQRLGIFGSAAVILIVVPSAALRLYQQHQAVATFAGMVNAAKTTIPLSSHEHGGIVSLEGPNTFDDVRLLEVDVNRWACGASPTITFRYDSKDPEYDFSRAVPVPSARAHQPTKIFEPILSGAFTALEFSPDAAGCVTSAYWVNTDQRPLVLAATLGPGWESQRLFQRLWFESRILKDPK